MSSEKSFLFRLMVIQFYKQNMGLFLFLFLLFFGIIPPQHLIATHAALIQAQLSSIPLMIGVSFFWVLYAWRCIRFISQTCRQYRHSFLYIYQTLPKAKSYQILARCFIVMYLPVLIYAITIIIIAGVQGVYWHLICSILFLISTVIVAIFLSHRSLQHPSEPRQASRLPRFARISAKKNISISFVLLSYLWADKKIGLVAQKIFSYLSFNFFFIRNAAIFREDYFTFFVFLIGAMNALLIYNTHKMLEEKLAFLRNLPLSMPRRLLMVATTGMILFLPELIIMLISGFELLAWSESLTLHGLLASQFVLLFVILYTSRLSLKKYVQYIFLLLLSYLVLYLLFPTVLIIVFNLGMAYLIFHEQYHLYEHKTATS
jgi:hypothetical protein